METAHTAQTVHEHTDRQLHVALLVVYLVDALLLAGFCLAGVGNWSSPLAFAACGLLISGGSALASAHGGAPPMSDPRRVLLQVLAAVCLVLLVAWCDPPLAAMMLLTVVGVLSAAALRLAPNWLMAVALLTAVAATAVVVFHGGQLSLPVAGWAQQVMTGLFLLWTLAKAVSTHLAGTALRMQLNASHAQLATALEQVRRLAEVDELTGVANRRRVLAALADERSRCLRQSNCFSVAMLDIDNFKHINDNHGHPKGDEVLAAVANLLRHSLRGPDLVGRFGGEEFLLLLPGAITAEAALQTAERLRKAVANHSWADLASDLQVTVSVGVATSTADEPVERLLERADRGLYQAKHAGRNRVACGTASTP